MEIHHNWFRIFRDVKCLSFACCILPLLLALVCTPLWAEGGAVRKVPMETEGIVKLVATLQDSPAFTDVEWKLYRLDLPGRPPVMTIRRHAAIVNLKPGKYRVVALWESIVRSRAFDLKSSETTEVIVPMDN